MSAPDAAPVVTDQERANAWIVRWWRDTEPDERTHDEQRDLAEEFGAVRLHERRAIAAWLRSWEGAGATVTYPISLLRRMAERIERGEHGS